MSLNDWDSQDASRENAPYHTMQKMIWIKKIPSQTKVYRLIIGDPAKVKNAMNQISHIFVVFIES